MKKRHGSAGSIWVCLGSLPNFHTCGMCGCNCRQRLCLLSVPSFHTCVNPTAGPDGQHVRLVSVPSFHRKATLVLLNLRTLDCRAISFEGACGALPMEE